MREVGPKEEEFGLNLEEADSGRNGIRTTGEIGSGAEGCAAAALVVLREDSIRCELRRSRDGAE